jgi:aerobic carbon-monoxide dehydrogenase small subunit
MADQIVVTFTLNGERRSFSVAPGRRLLDLVREEAGLHGAKEGCGAGECGACTVLLDGKPVTACLVLAATVEGREVVTVEGLAGAVGALHPFQAALVAQGGVQCGFCTPGVAVTGAAIVAQGITDTDEQARLLAGNLCRCTGYSKIFAALGAAAKETAHGDR